MYRFTFEIIPAGWDGVRLEGLAFKPMLLDVPALGEADEDSAARRAYWQAFHLLGPRGIEPEEFEVFSWSESFGRGQRVGPGGLVTEGRPS
jgi:hypothetical protein